MGSKSNPMKNQPDNFMHQEITNKIIGAFFNVYNKLGYGFLEKVYQNALLIEISKFGLNATAQMPIKVFYESCEVGYYFADLIVNDLVIVEIKACEGLIAEHEAQLVNYLKATDLEVGLLVNFGIKPTFKRKVFSNNFKTLI
jgi:GxxExxY protein